MTVEDLRRLKEKHQIDIFLREGKYRLKVLIHMGECGLQAGARRIMHNLIDKINKEEIKDIALIPVDCAGVCSKEPMITIEEPNKPPVRYCLLNEKKIKEIVDEHIIKGNILNEYLLEVSDDVAS
jgi:NADP-reducing hydrogenase subunit HndB